MCVICNKTADAGISVLAAFICFSCEQKITTLSPNEAGYDFYRLRLKSFWEKALPACQISNI
ncbi:MAG: sigma factor G inhibitor Gin [Bacillota bacterium]